MSPRISCYGRSGKRDLTTFVVTETMHESKRSMFMNADAVGLLPGGAAPRRVLREVLHGASCAATTSPFYLLDIKGYWQPLVALIDHGDRAGLREPSLNGYIETSPT